MASGPRRSRSSRRSSMSDEPRPDLRLVPFAVASWAVMWLATGGLVAPWLLVAGVVAVAGVGAVLGRKRAWLIALCATAAAVATIGALRVDRFGIGEVARLAREQVVVEADVRLLAEPVLFAAKGARPALAISRVELVGIIGRGGATTVALPARLMASGELAARLGDLAPGSIVRLLATARSPEPGEPFAVVLRAREPPTVLSEPGLADQAVNGFRRALRASMRASPGAQAALVPSLVVGDTAGISDEMSEQFKATALTHLMAVSGANLTLMLGFLLFVVKWAGVRGWAVRVISIGGVVAFVAVCRAEPSVVRAAAMGLVALAALGAGRDRAKGIRHLCVAVLGLLMFDPWLARTWGFALSVAASAGILWWAPGWQRAMRRWAPDWLAEAICIPLAAQLATQPLITALSGQLSVIGVLANAVVGPFVGPATVLGLLAAVVGSAWDWLGVPFGFAAGWVVQPIIWAAAWGSALPGSVWTLSSSPGTIAALAVACLGIGGVLTVILGRRLWVALLACVLIVVSAWRPEPLGWPGSWRVAFCDVGQGDSTVLRAASNQAVVIDVGPDGASAVSCLRSLGVRRIPLLILTHYHADHVGGLTAVLGAFDVGQVMVSRLASPVGVVRRVAGDIAAAGGSVKTASPGERLVVGDVAWTTVWAGDASAAVTEGDVADSESAVENDSSIIGVAEVGGLRVLSAGDAEPTAQSAALRFAQQVGISLQVHVLKLPHHGSSRQDEAFFEVTQASLAVASAGVRNDYGHPAQKTLALASRLGMALRRTDLDGTIAVWLDGGQLGVRTRGK